MLCVACVLGCMPAGMSCALACAAHAGVVVCRRVACAGCWVCLSKRPTRARAGALIRARTNARTHAPCMRPCLPVRRTEFLGSLPRAASARLPRHSHTSGMATQPFTGAGEGGLANGFAAVERIKAKNSLTGGWGRRWLWCRCVLAVRRCGPWGVCVGYGCMCCGVCGLRRALI